MPRAVIAGGGIGGMTAALAFAHFGWEAVVLEQAGAFDEVGAGLQISPNAMKVFRAIGAEPHVRRDAFAPEALEMRNGRSGGRIFQIKMADRAERRWGAPYLHLHRADLLDALVEAARETSLIELRPSSRLETYEASGEGAVALLEGGGFVQGDVLVGADGVHSAVRRQMLGPDAPDFTGNVAWRAVVPMDRLGSNAPPPTACVWVGPKRHAVTYRLRRGELANFVGVVEHAGWRAESWTETGTREDMLADFEGWHPAIRTLIEQAESHHRWALFDRKPLPRWSDNRAVLIGDAAHPTLPFMAQGAVLAIEDAYALSRACAARPENPTPALEAFYKSRIERTSAVQTGSRARMKTFHKRTSLGRLSTYGPMRLAGAFLPGAVRARQDWLYGHDVTA